MEISMKKIIETFIAACAAIAAVISGYFIFFQSKDTATSTSTANNTTTKTSTSTSIGQDGTEDTSSSLKDGTYTGEVTSTDRGDYQVQMTVASGKITAIDILEYPNENSRSEQINSSALPTYTAEAIDSQSANVTQISGATEAYNGFTGSLQDAINQAQS